MKLVIILVTFLLNRHFLLAQKPLIDSSVFGIWPYLGGIEDAQISSDGNYLSYLIANQPVVDANTLVVRATNGSWQRHFNNHSNGHITKDSKWLIFKTDGDSLCMVRLGTEKIIWLTGIKSFELLRTIKNEYLAYRVLAPTRKDELVLLDYRTWKEKKIGVPDGGYRFFAKYNALLFLRSVPHKDDAEIYLEWIDLATEGKKTLWRGRQVWNYTLDEKHDQLMVLGQERPKDPSTRCIWYYKVGMDNAVEMFNHGTLQDTNFIIDIGHKIVFNKNGTRVLFGLIEKSVSNKNAGNGVKVDIWSYRDVRTQDTQLNDEQFGESSARKRSMVINLADHRARLLQSDDTKFYSDEDFERSTDYVALAKGGLAGDFWLEATDRSSPYLVSLQDGNETLLKRTPNYDQLFPPLRFYLSPDEKYVLHYDPIQGKYFSLSIDTRAERNITKHIAEPWRKDMNNFRSLPTYAEPYGIAGWLERKRAVLLYDKYDIWQIDLNGDLPPINITNGYGRLHNIQLRIATENYQPVINTGDKLLLAAFDPETKYTGFYNQIVGDRRGPTFLTMGPFIYGYPKKAIGGNTWLVQRESAEEAPNLFATKDFKGFQAMSDLRPQNRYNWLHAELVKWQTLDGDFSQGILYKPENFDSTRKYPTLFNYYAERSNELYQFKVPEVTRDIMNIPYFVSHGYLVFIPDIQFGNGMIPGESAANSVISAARHLSQYSWVDSTKMGIQGHSFGGGLTNYLVTHSQQFAAAAEGAGPSDAISAYGSTLGGGQGRQFFFETGQERIRATLWERPDLYIRESAILFADKVTTPLLMMHNKEDALVPWGQAMELFMGLRRLGKRVWLLQYDGEGHSLGGMRQAMDYTIRLEQFFDHYLKGAPPPKWMTEGIPASRKGIDTGYALDTSGKKP